MLVGRILKASVVFALLLSFNSKASAKGINEYGLFEGFCTVANLLLAEEAFTGNFDELKRFNETLKTDRILPLGSLEMVTEDLFDASQTTILREIARFVSENSPSQIRNLILNTGSLYSFEVLNSGQNILEKMFVTPRFYAMMSKKELRNLTSKKLKSDFGIGVWIDGDEPRATLNQIMIHDKAIEKYPADNNEHSQQLLDSLDLSMPEEKLFIIPNFGFFYLCTYEFHPNFNSDFQLITDTDFDYIINVYEDLKEKAFYAQAGIFSLTLNLLEDIHLGANISGSGVILSITNCQEPGKVNNKCTQVALINDSGLILALTEKLDVRERHRLKSGKKVKFSDCFLTEIRNTRGIGESDFSAFVTNLTDNVKTALIEGLEAGRAAQGLQPAIKDSMFALTLQLLTGTERSQPLEAITCELSSSNITIIN